MTLDALDNGEPDRTRTLLTGIRKKLARMERWKEGGR
jgi:hypothetical protein